MKGGDRDSMDVFESVNCSQVRIAQVGNTGTQIRTIVTQTGTSPSMAMTTNTMMFRSQRAYKRRDVMAVHQEEDLSRYRRT